MKKKISRERLSRIIKFCGTIQKMEGDPFDVDVKKALETLEEYLPHWKEMDDLLLDVEAIRMLSTVIELQGRWVKNRSSSLYDPSLIEMKIGELDAEKLGSAFIKSWHPISAMDQLTPQRLKEGMDYWNVLLPIDERKEEFPQTIASGILSPDDLAKLKILGREFNESIKKIHEELKEKGKINYWDFIYADKFEESIMRAYLTSYLVTDGHAELEIKPLEGEIFLIPREEKIDVKKEKVKPRSIPIAMGYEDWVKHGRS